MIHAHSKLGNLLIVVGPYLFSKLVMVVNTIRCTAGVHNQLALYKFLSEREREGGIMCLEGGQARLAIHLSTFILISIPPLNIL